MPSAVDDKAKKPVFINKPLDWSTTFNLSQAVRSVRFVEDGEGNIWGFPVVMVDPAGNSPIEARAAVVIRDATTPGTTANVIAPSVADLGVASFRALEVYSAQVVYNNVTPGWEAQRTPTIFKNVASASDFNVWDPAAGKKFRLMGFTIRGVAPSLGAAAVNSVALVDNATDIFTFWFFCNTAIATARDFSVTVNLPGNGYLSIAADNILNANIGTGLTAGYIEVNAWGTEE